MKAVIYITNSLVEIPQDVNKAMIVDMKDIEGLRRMVGIMLGLPMAAAAADEESNTVELAPAPTLPNGLIIGSGSEKVNAR